MTTHNVTFTDFWRDYDDELENRFDEFIYIEKTFPEINKSFFTETIIDDNGKEPEIYFIGKKNLCTFIIFRCTINLAMGKNYPCYYQIEIDAIEMFAIFGIVLAAKDQEIRTFKKKMKKIQEFFS